MGNSGYEFTLRPRSGYVKYNNATDKYQALNGLTLRGVWLVCEAFKDGPIPIILFENVPRIMTRGRPLLDQISAILRSYTYNVAETVHDCGELGGLAQSRKRFLLIARQREIIPNFIYEPEKKRLRGVGEVIGKLPLPGDPVAGPMHRVPMLQWKTWLRLALVPAGRDWRALNELAVVDGVLRDYGIVPDRELRDGSLGVMGWGDTAGVVVGNQRSPLHGRHSVADPRTPEMHNEGLGVRSRQDPARVVASASRPGNGAHSVADPRPGYGDATHRHVLGVNGWNETAPTVSGNPKPSSGSFAVADPRPQQDNQTYGQYGVRPWDEPAGTVTSQSLPGGGPNSIADPRKHGKPAFNNVFRVVAFNQPTVAVSGPGGPAGGAAVADPRMAESDYTTTKYKITPWEGQSRAVIGASTTGDGAFAVADPRTTHGPNAHQNKMRVVSADDPRADLISAASDEAEKIKLPEPAERLVARIIATDGTWHRPFTTLDLCALQSIVDPEEAFYQDRDGSWHARRPFDLDSKSDAEKREWIGNAVPSESAEEIGGVIGEALLLADMGETFTLSTKAIWVSPLRAALAVDTDQAAFRMEAGR